MRSGRPAPEELAARRASIEMARIAGLWTTDPAPEEIWPGGVRALRFAAPGQARATVVHFHGGGFRQGCPEMVGHFAAALSSACGVDVVCPAYSLAPEAPFPAGLQDGARVVEALAAEKLILSGDSAGGGLAAALVVKGVRPMGLILLSAWLDLTVTSACYRDNAASDPLFSTEAATEAAEQYLQGQSPHDPLASPLFATVGSFPPTLVSVGSGEVLRADAELFHERLRAASIPVTLDVVEGMDHVAVTRGADLPGSRETFAAIVAFVEDVLT